jgi:hypothetical protein
VADIDMAKVGCEFRHFPPHVEAGQAARVNDFETPGMGVY